MSSKTAVVLDTNVLLVTLPTRSPYRVILFVLHGGRPVHERIELNPMVCHGKPVIRGTRVMVSTILGALAAGDTHEMILEDYPNIGPEDITAALSFASELSQFEEMHYQVEPA